MERTILQAHRGVSTDYPENTMAAFIGAVVQGYPIIEMDPMYTKDGQIVLLHDRALNRTARHPDGSKLEETVELADLTYEEALGYDYGIWFGKKFQGEPLLLLRDVLRFAAEFDVEIKIDNKIQSFPPEMLEALYAIIEASPAKVGITSPDLEFIKGIRKRLPEADIHYDGVVTEELAARLGLWILSEHSDYRDAVERFHPYVVETTGNLKPSNTADIV